MYLFLVTCIHLDYEDFLALDAFMANEYMRVPAIAIEEPTILPVLMGVLNATTEATIMTTRLMVLPTAWVTGLTLPRAKKATSL